MKRLTFLSLIGSYFAFTWAGSLLAQPVIDGNLSAGEYGAALSIQNTETNFGDALNGDTAIAVGGSEIDQVFGTIRGGRLYVLITGNLESNLNKLEVFIDSVPGGVNRIDSATLPAYIEPNTGGAFEQMHGLTFDAGFEADRYLTFSNGTQFVSTGTFWALTSHFADMTGGPGGHVSNSGMQLYPHGLEPGLTQGVPIDQLNNGCIGAGDPFCSPSQHEFAEANYRNMLNDVGLRMAIDNSNTMGVVAGTGPTTGNPQDVVSGIEFSLPLSQLGNPTGEIKVTAFINGVLHDYASNQFSGVGVLQGNFAAPSNVDLAAVDGEQFVLVPIGPTAPFNIFHWKYVDPQDPSQGKQESSALTADGYGLRAAPGLVASNRILSMAYLRGADLTNASFANTDLSDAQLDQANLSNANFNGAKLTGADLTGSEVRGAKFGAGSAGFQAGTGLTAAQLALTASYQARDLTGIQLAGNNLAGANLAGQNLTAADLRDANLTGANLSQAVLNGAQVRGGNFASTGITLAQLYSTSDYQAKDLTGIGLAGVDLTEANFVGQRLVSAKLTAATLTRADLTNADLTGIALANANLRQANLTGARVTGTLTRANLSQANLTAADLTGANLTGANLSGAVLANAVVKYANLASTNITLSQLYSTASYQAHDLTGVQFVGNDLSGANLAGQLLASTSFYAAKLVGADLTNAILTNAEFVNADLSQANLTGVNLIYGTLAFANLSDANLTNANLNGVNFIGTNLAGAEIRGANLSKVQIQTQDPYDSYLCGPKHNGAPCTFSKPILYWGFPAPVVQTIGTGISLAQLVSTASYGARDLSGVTLANSNFNGGNFAGFNLTNATFSGTSLTGANFSGADARGAIGLSSFAAPNLIRPDGHIVGLNLSAGQSLSIRDYDGNSAGIIPIKVDQQLATAPGATLRMIFEADVWDSTLSFSAGIPVALGGNLELTFATDVNLSSQIGRTFDLFDWAGVTPSSAFTLSSPYVWNLSNLYTTGEVTFLAASGLAGDFNGDGAVDAADYTALRSGPSAIYTRAAFSVWKSNYGARLDNGGGLSQGSPASTAVPEPSSLLLICVGLIALLRARGTQIC